jgi:HD-like signal output (HDOD) protein
MAEAPSSIKRLEPFPDFAIELLNRIGSNAETLDLAGLLAGKPQLLDDVSRVAAESIRVSGGQIADLESLPEPAASRRAAEIAITLLVREYLQSAFLVSEDYRYWRYTLACAVCSEQVALPRGENALLAYAAGLLHDIGRLALIAAYPAQYSNLLTLTDRMFVDHERFDMLEYERLLFGLDHFDTGAWVAQAWKLPAWLGALAGKFDEKKSGDFAVLVGTIRAGARLAHSLGFGYLTAAPRADFREILAVFPDADKHWKVLDSWEYGEENLRGKVRARLRWYSPDE